MSQAVCRSRGLHPIRIAASFFRASDWTFNRIDPDGLRRVATVSVWLHWFIVPIFVALLVYRPAYGPERYTAYAVLLLLLVAFNGYTHLRLARNRTMTWRWILLLVAMDGGMVSIATVIGGGFSHYFLHLLYYPTLAGYALVFTPFRLTMAWVTVVSVLYLVMCLTVGDGIALNQSQGGMCIC